ncbi:hypothetical protein EDEG_01088 [Edhazardia aedis USNM 41457]|uniref:Uncharacterized protein n=1 Tax=Edhazardia aedis (strain USNM 41457) TaxID=1003232 RepID=J9DQ96_EDHAE|nr:hypothetical protein EDEG_01088 [Edhazardia aedis USNM 41457]|eukprot:EJW04725.1 hypothetical protein EDEG_01088 [Edhazardia aedis USNM 41457]
MKYVILYIVFLDLLFCSDTAKVEIGGEEITEISSNDQNQKENECCKSRVLFIHYLENQKYEQHRCIICCDDIRRFSSNDEKTGEKIDLIDEKMESLTDVADKKCYCSEMCVPINLKKDDTKECEQKLVVDFLIKTNLENPNTKPNEDN